jgi:hypothetical protein
MLCRRDEVHRCVMLLAVAYFLKDKTNLHTRIADVLSSQFQSEARN